MRQLYRPYLQHARRHLPTGSDPIQFPETADDDFFPQSQVLPLGLPDQFSPTGADLLIDSSRRNNYRWKFDGAGTSTLVWPIALGPPAGESGQAVYLNAGVGGSYGTISCYLAGAYSDIPALISSGDWILVSTYDLSINPASGLPYGADQYDPYLHSIDHLGGYVTGPCHAWSFSPSGGVDIGTLSTTISSSGVLDGGPGYYFLRLDCTDLTELSEVVLLNGRHGSG